MKSQVVVRPLAWARFGFAAVFALMGAFAFAAPFLMESEGNDPGVGRWVALAVALFLWAVTLEIIRSKIVLRSGAIEFGRFLRPSVRFALEDLEFWVEGHDSRGNYQLMKDWFFFFRGQPRRKSPIPPWLLSSKARQAFLAYVRSANPKLFRERTTKPVALPPGRPLQGASFRASPGRTAGNLLVGVAFAVLGVALLTFDPRPHPLLIIGVGAIVVTLVGMGFRGLRTGVKILSSTELSIRMGGKRRRERIQDLEIVPLPDGITKAGSVYNSTFWAIRKRSTQELVLTRVYHHFGLRQTRRLHEVLLPQIGWGTFDVSEGTRMLALGEEHFSERNEAIV